MEDVGALDGEFADALDAFMPGDYGCDLKAADQLLSGVAKSVPEGSVKASSSDVRADDDFDLADVDWAAIEGIAAPSSPRPLSPCGSGPHSAPAESAAMSSRTAAIAATGDRHALHVHAATTSPSVAAGPGTILVAAQACLRLPPILTRGLQNTQRAHGPTLAPPPTPVESNLRLSAPAVPAGSALSEPHQAAPAPAATAAASNGSSPATASLEPSPSNPAQAASAAAEVCNSSAGGGATSPTAATGHKGSSSDSTGASSAAPAPTSAAPRPPAPPLPPAPPPDSRQIAKAAAAVAAAASLGLPPPDLVAMGLLPAGFRCRLPPSSSAPMPAASASASASACVSAAGSPRSSSISLACTPPRGAEMGAAGGGGRAFRRHPSNSAAHHPYQRTRAGSYGVPAAVLSAMPSLLSERGSCPVLVAAPPAPSHGASGASTLSAASSQASHGAAPAAGSLGRQSSWDAAAAEMAAAVFGRASACAGESRFAAAPGVATPFVTAAAEPLSPVRANGSGNSSSNNAEGSGSGGKLFGAGPSGAFAELLSFKSDDLGLGLGPEAFEGMDIDFDTLLDCGDGAGGGSGSDGKMEDEDEEMRALRALLCGRGSEGGGGALVGLSPPPPQRPPLPPQPQPQPCLPLAPACTPAAQPASPHPPPPFAMGPGGSAFAVSHSRRWGSADGRLSSSGGGAGAASIPSSNGAAPHQRAPEALGPACGGGSDADGLSRAWSDPQLRAASSQAPAPPPLPMARSAMTPAAAAAAAAVHRPGAPARCTLPCCQPYAWPYGSSAPAPVQCRTGAVPGGSDGMFQDPFSARTTTGGYLFSATSGPHAPPPPPPQQQQQPGVPGTCACAECRRAAMSGGAPYGPGYAQPPPQSAHRAPPPYPTAAPGRCMLPCCNPPPVCTLPCCAGPGASWRGPAPPPSHGPLLPAQGSGPLAPPPQPGGRGQPPPPGPRSYTVQPPPQPSYNLYGYRDSAHEVQEYSMTISGGGGGGSSSMNGSYASYGYPQTSNSGAAGDAAGVQPAGGHGAPYGGTGMPYNTSMQYSGGVGGVFGGVPRPPSAPAQPGTYAGLAAAYGTALGPAAAAAAGACR
ncbi:hypothetical protein HYH03_018023 [Edaphochlamys debaryana]|uniref:Uncharacterized protein n=1 Tax=Edaphochlamys debaryana TaxID=47281 RepID=A0A835XHA6_9CHLO|nr:hypothetical protein HYH03_018023 [Edaphochlamys debaryana]|eukprot:KAG2483082.1 hypothetical protein HYH03_018023 [Edaphochlamys debaryana]